MELRVGLSFQIRINVEKIHFRRSILELVFVSLNIVRDYREGTIASEGERERERERETRRYEERERSGRRSNVFDVWRTSSF